MIKKLLVVLCVSALLPFGTNAQWVSLDNNRASNTPPEITILSEDNSGIVIKVDVAGFNVKEFVSDGKTYQSVDLLSEIFATNPGDPEIPYLAKVLAIPDQASISVEVLETGPVQTFSNINLQPARVSWMEGQREPAYKENADFYRSAEVYPKEYAEVEPPSVFRDFRIARVSVFPLRYVPAKKEIQAVSSMTVRINYGRGEVVNPKTSATKDAISPSFAKLYRSFIFNYQYVLDNRYNKREDGREVILCIMPDELYESFLTYADWKRQSGTDTHVTKFSDIGANSNNADIIKDHIEDAYFNWENPPTYVLIVGDNGVFPKKIVTYPDYSFPTEDYFVSVDGDDFFPEMMIGRFTNQGDYRMQVMINKYMLYEKNPYVEDTDWFTKATCCSNNDYASQVSTKRFTANIMLEEGGFKSVDTLMSDGSGWGGSGCSMDLDDVISTINEGRSYLNYRGEGWVSGWSASCYHFEADDVYDLENGQKFTFVTSIGCGVAMFDANGGNCFGEEWIQVGSLTEPRGGVAFVGPTSNTHTTYNNKIDKGIYVGMFMEDMDTPGQALLRGKLYMYNVFGADYYCEYHYKVYCVLGDPSIHIWKDVPQAVNVDHASSITVGSNEMEVTVTHTASGEPVKNAEICFSGIEVFATAMTDSTGKAMVEIIPESPDTLKITVRGGNVIPYQTIIDIIQPVQWIEPDGDPMIVDLDGNTDGLINPNENCNITFTLKNWGTETVNGIQATLSAVEPEFVEVISTNPVDFGDLSPGATFIGDPYQVYIKADCPVGMVIPLKLNISSGSSSWDHNFSAVVLGCELTNGDFMINEIGIQDPNYKMDPGETAKLFISVKNIGADVAPNVMGVLSSNDQYITIIDSTSSFGSLDTSGIAINTENYFVISVDASCPTEYMLDCNLRLYTEDGNYPYETTPTFSLPIALPILTDYTGPDAYGYYAYASTDAFYDQTPVYEWFDLHDIGTQIIVPPETSDYTVTVNLPFTFKYYEQDYDQVRISTDGWLALGSGIQTAAVNTPLANNDNVDNMVAVFWDDLYEGYSGEGKLLYYNDVANHRFIVEWDSISHNDFGNEPNKEAFQAILLDPAYYSTTTGDGEIIFQYKKLKDITSNTIGIENQSQDVCLQYVFNQEYDPTASTISEGFAIKFTTEAPYVSVIVSVDDDPEMGSELVPDGFSLEQNYPNPFNSSTWINYSIPEQTHVSLNVYDVRGKLVRVLQDGSQAAGKYSVEWNGLNSSGSSVKAGLYFYRLQTDDYKGARKLFILK